METVLALVENIDFCNRESLESIGVSNYNLSGWNWPETEKESTIENPYWIIIVEEKRELEGRGLHAHLFGTAYLFSGKPKRIFPKWTRSTHVEFSQPAL